jgi:hypothetical protein
MAFLDYFTTCFSKSVLQIKNGKDIRTLYSTAAVGEVIPELPEAEAERDVFFDYFGMNKV